jgi:gluconate 2-dehydrogenase
MKVLVTRAWPEANLAAIRDGFDATLATTGLTEAQAAQALKDFDAILCTLGDAFTARALAGGPHRTKLLANFGVGVNHIDVAAARAAGIAVTNTPGAVTDATADLALTLILMAARRAGEGERLLRAGAWTGWEPTQLLGTHVTGLTLGIVGMGRIGEAVAHRAHHGFAMPVIFHNRSPKTHPFARQAPTLMDVMQGADVVVATVPGGAETRHLIGRAEIEAMRPGALLVNVARGGVVDEEALADALDAGRLRAGLDVYEGEPAVNPRLLLSERAVLLPHLGTAALPVREAMGRMALDNLRAFAEGRDLPNEV